MNEKIETVPQDPAYTLKLREDDLVRYQSDFDRAENELKALGPAPEEETEVDVSKESESLEYTSKKQAIELRRDIARVAIDACNREMEALRAKIAPHVN